MFVRNFLMRLNTMPDNGQRLRSRFDSTIPYSSLLPRPPHHLPPPRIHPTKPQLRHDQLTLQVTLRCKVFAFRSITSKTSQPNIVIRYSYAGGFFTFFIYIYMGMCALGLSIEAMITLMTPRFVPCFLVLLVCPPIRFLVISNRWMPDVLHNLYL